VKRSFFSMADRRGPAWLPKLALYGAIMVVGWGLRPAITSVGPLLTSLQAEFQVGSAQAALLISVPEFFMGLLALGAPLLAARIGLTQSVVLALALTGTATVLRALTSSYIEMILATSLIGVGIAVAGALVSGWIKEHHPGQTIQLTALFATGLSLGAIAGASLVGPISDAAGSWRWALGGWGLLPLLSIAGWLLLQRFFAGPRDDEPKTSTPASVRLPWRNRSAWAVAAYFGATNLIYYCLVAWIAPMLALYGGDDYNGGHALTVFIFTNLMGNLGAGYLPSTSISRRPWLLASSALTLAALLCLVPFTPAAITAGAALCGLALGSAFTFGMTLPLDRTSTAQEANQWTAFTLFIGYLAASLGPVLFGYFLDWTDSYLVPVLFLVGVCAFKLALAVFMNEAPGGAAESKQRVVSMSSRR
jgi:MFS transporter, CP family, cyanate transporter